MYAAGSLLAVEFNIAAWTTVTIRLKYSYQESRLQTFTFPLD